jgi:hypothetical protein
MAVEDQPVEDDDSGITNNQQFRAHDLGLGPRTTSQVKAREEQVAAGRNLAGKVPPSIITELRTETAARTASDDAARKARDPKPAVKKAAATRQANRLKKNKDPYSRDPDTGFLLRDGKPLVYGPLPPTEASPRSGIIRGVNRGFLETDPPTQQPGWSAAASRTAVNRAPGNTRDFTGVMRDTDDVKPREIALPSQTGDTSGFGEQAGEFELNQVPTDAMGGLQVDDTAHELVQGPKGRSQPLRKAGPKKVDTGDDVAQSAGYVARPDVIKEQAALQAAKRPVAQQGTAGSRKLGRGEVYGPAIPRVGDVRDIRATGGDPVTFKTDSGSTVSTIPVTARRFTGESWEDIQTNAHDALVQTYPRVVKYPLPSVRTSAEDAGPEMTLSITSRDRPAWDASPDVDFRGERASNTPRPGILPGDPTYPKVNREQAATAASAEELEAARAERETSTRGQRMIADVAAGLRATGKLEVNRGGVRTLVNVPKGTEDIVADLTYLQGRNRAGERVLQDTNEARSASTKISEKKAGQAPTQGVTADVRTTLEEALRGQYEGLMRGPVTNTGTQRDPVTGITDIRNVRASRDTRPGSMGDTGRLVFSKANRPRVLPPEVREAYPGMDDDGIVFDRDTGQMMRWNERTESVEPVTINRPDIGDLPVNSRAREELTRAAFQRRAQWNEQERADDREATARTLDQLKQYGPRATDVPTFDEAYRQHRQEIGAETARNQRLGLNPISSGAPGGADPISAVAGRRQVSNEEAEALIAGRKTPRQEQAEAISAQIDASISEVMRRQSAGEDIDVNAEIARIKRELGGN